MSSAALATPSSLILPGWSWNMASRSCLPIGFVHGHKLLILKYIPYRCPAPWSCRLPALSWRTWQAAVLADHDSGPVWTEPNRRTSGQWLTLTKRIFSVALYSQFYQNHQNAGYLVYFTFIFDRHHRRSARWHLSRDFDNLRGVFKSKIGNIPNAETDHRIFSNTNTRIAVGMKRLVFHITNIGNILQQRVSQ